LKSSLIGDFDKSFRNKDEKALMKLLDEYVHNCEPKPSENLLKKNFEDLFHSNSEIFGISQKILNDFNIGLLGNKRALDIKCPVLIFHGEKDKIVPIKLHE